VVQLAELNHQLLIVSLGDALNDCGDQDGVPAGAHGKEPSWYATGYQTRYLAWVRQVVTRYAQSPAIGMWEILNESGAAAGGTIADTTMRAFFDDVAGTIKQLDPNHLVESGTQAEYNPGTSDYAVVHGGPNVDVGSLHEYDYDYNDSHTIVSPHLAPTLTQMNSLNKPLIIGETGIRGNDIAMCTSRAMRRDAFRQKFDAYFMQDVAAVLVWNWSATARTDCAYETIDPNDPLMTLLRTY
jgi:mannan endo-1,4-beta-mannosidase